MAPLGRALLLIAGVLALAGALLLIADRLGLGRLPGDLVFRGKNTTVYFPIVTSFVVSVILTLLLNLFLRRK